MKTLVISLSLAAAVPALSQAPAGVAPQSTKGVVRKKLAPVSSEVLRVKLPRPVERKLSNGLRVIIVENHRVPTVSVNLLLPASTLNDPAGLPGVAEATAEMLKQGTRTRTSRQIAEQISELGAGLHVSAGWGSRTTFAGGGTLSENLDSLLEIMSDVLLNPAFPEDEFAKWKKRKLGALQQMRANEQVLGSERLHDVLYGGDPRAVTHTTPDSVQKMTRADLEAFHKKYYVPGGALLGVTGDVAPDELVAKLEKYFRTWSAAGAADPDLQVKTPVPDRKIILVNRPGSVQTLLMLGNHAIGRTSPDYPVVMVLNQVLGAGPASRLFINIREEKGFTYGVYSSFRADRYLDHFAAASSVRTEVTGAAIDEFLKEFRRIREEAVPAEELENAKRAIVANFALSLENQDGVLSRILAQKDFNLPADYWDTYPEKITAVTAADVQAAARRYVPLENVQLVAVGDAAKIKDVLKKYGAVEQYDTEGKKTE